jgi:putative intracellular protease/amidase
MVVLIPIPDLDFDPTETGVPWRMLRQRGHQIVFATPNAGSAHADQRMITGEGFGILATLMMADSNGRSAYKEMSKSEEFVRPISYEDIDPNQFDGLLLPGGHAPGMREYLESQQLQSIVGKFFSRSKPVGAICHGVLLAARSRGADGKSVLHGKKTTALPKFMELAGWALTCLNLGNYFRTYSTPVEDEVRRTLASPSDFIRGPFSVVRDSPDNLKSGFTVRDGNYLSARWPGDAHRFANEFALMLET